MQISLPPFHTLLKIHIFLQPKNTNICFLAASARSLVAALLGMTVCAPLSGSHCPNVINNSGGKVKGAEKGVWPKFGVL